LRIDCFDGFACGCPLDGGNDELDELRFSRASNSATLAFSSTTCFINMRTAARASSGQRAIISSVTTISIPP
jgi:hypothetical protein